MCWRLLMEEVSKEVPNKIETEVKDAIGEALRKDGWANVFVGLGQKKDKAKYTEYGDITLLDDATLESIYMGDGLASSRRVISP